MIKIKNLSKKYNDQYVLKNINLTLPSKGLIGISGESGSGKSTFLNALSLMDKNNLSISDIEEILLQHFSQSNTEQDVVEIAG